MKLLGRGQGKAAEFLLVIALNLFFAALERLLGRLLHGHDHVCLKTLPVRDNCFRSLIKAM